MTPDRKAVPIRALLSCLALGALTACVTSPATSDTLVVDQEAVLEGEVVSVDATPWTYDGNAVVTVSATSAGTVKVQLPARWNLCRAEPPGDVQGLKPGDRVHVAGTAIGADAMVVCAQATHHLRKVE